MFRSSRCSFATSPTAILLVAPLAVAAQVLLLPVAARAAQPRAAVTFLESADQSTSDLKSLRALLERQLEQHDIKVVRKPAPPLVSKSPRQIKSYAKRKHLDRVYDVRLRSRGQRLEVVLTERKAPSMRSTFSARLSAAGPDKVQKVIPKLVGAVVARTEPESEEETAPEPAAQLQAKPEASAPAPALAADEPKPAGEFLVGVSIDMGTFLNTAAGQFGGTGKAFYQWSSLRLGVELGGSGGSGSTFHGALRGDFLFSRSRLSPYVGAGVGYLMTKDAAKSEGGGGYFSASTGLEYSRWRKLHLLAEAEVLLPFFSATHEEMTNRNGIVNLLSVSAYSPVFLFKVGCLY